MKLEDALRIRDNPKITYAKGMETVNKDDFDTLWDKYINYCQYQIKLAFTTLKKKRKVYNRYLKGQFLGKFTKIQKSQLALFVDNLSCTDKTKNEIIKTLKAFFNWCYKESHIFSNPMIGIEKYRVEKPNMKYWIPSELKKFLDILNYDIDNNKKKEQAYRTKIVTLIGFILGDRIGECRALTFDCFDKIKVVANIKHSINQDSSSNDFLSNTKNYHSQREVYITSKLIDELEKYRWYLVNELGYDVKDNSIIFFNYSTNRPYSDTTLRKQFYYYCDKAEVPKIRLYDLRHTYVATMMSEGKELYLISERLGHSSYSTTVNKYGHLSTQVKKEVAETTDKYY